MTQPSRKILIISNTSFSIINFRMYLVQRLIDDGHNVTVVAAEDAYSDQIKNMNVNFIPWNVHRSSTNPLSEFVSISNLFMIFKKVQPDLILSFTIKPNTYASIAGYLLRIPVIAVVTGLGYAFNNKNLSAFAARISMFCGLTLASKILVQNYADTDFIKSGNRILNKKTEYIAGSGIDSDHYSADPTTYKDEPVIFTLIARLLTEKGVGEFIEAASIIKTKYSDVVFRIVGAQDNDNPAAISFKKIEEAVNRGNIEYHQPVKDIRPFIRDSSCIVLPTYYKEGIPRSLIEAASMSRPIIATNIAGCTDITHHELNGFLCEPKNVPSLVASIERFLNLSSTERRKMGEAGRQIVLNQFTNEIVFEKYKQTIESV